MECAACQQFLEPEEFSGNQWSKGEGYARCRICVQEGAREGSPPTARHNLPSRITFGSLDSPFAAGAFRYVQLGKYIGGERTGQACVVKWFKNASANLDTSYYENEEKTADEAIRLVELFNGANIVRDMIRVNRPSTSRFGTDVGPRWAGHYFSIEPFIEDFRKFNSNSGWVPSEMTSWDDAMQALSHFTYACSSGSRLLCDLQGGIYRDGAILTDPVIMSNVRGKFGPTDLGPEGIATFFARHQCNQFCRPHWAVPETEYVYYTTTAATTMRPF
jgi:hypothetical protein